MMMHAYPEMYLRRAMINLAGMFDYAINDFGMEANDFCNMFVSSEICRALEMADCKYLIGMCGPDLAIRIIEQTTGIEVDTEPAENYGRSPDYWIGWVLGYYQWQKCFSYKKIFTIASYDELREMYRTLHEADISKFADEMDRRCSEIIRESNLKRLRRAYGCSQSKLAQMSGVSLRSIQMYEQGNKDINKSHASSVISMARALGCRPESLLERM